MNCNNLIHDNYYTEMLERSLILPTNNQRLCSQLKNIASGKIGSKKANILLLGGSITAGYSPMDNITHPYPKLVQAFMEEQFPNTQFNFVNLGYAGLHSLFGLAQVEVHMEAQLNKQQNSKAKYSETFLTNTINTNIIFIEYAANNGFDMEYAKSFEGLIRKLLLTSPDAAILPICVRNKTGYTCEPYMAKIASYYNLPVISITNALSSGEAHGFIWEDYSMDLVHPSPVGHKLIADCIICLLRTSLLETAESSDNLVMKLPESSLYGDEFTCAQYFHADAIHEAQRGDFMSVSTHPLFPRGLKCIESDGLPLTLELTCEKLYILYEQSADLEMTGKLSVHISNQQEATVVEGYSIYAWGNPVMLKLIDGPRQSYSLQLKMLPVHKNSSFIILGFLYV